MTTASASSSSPPLHPLPHVPLPTLPPNGIAQRIADNCYIDESSERIRWVRDCIVAGQASPLISLLNIQWLHISMQKVVCQMKVDRRHVQPYGLVQGGIHALLAEHLGSMLGILHSSTGCVGVSVDAHHVGSATVGDTLEAECTPVRIGQTLALWRVRVTAVSASGTRNLVAISQLTTMRRPSKAVVAIQKTERQAYTPKGLTSNINRPVTDKAVAQRAATIATTPAADAQKQLAAEQSQTQINCNHFNVTPFVQRINTNKDTFKPVADGAFISPELQSAASSMLMSPLVTLLGLQFTHISPQRLEGQLTAGIEHMQPFAIANGGLAPILAEELGSVLSHILQRTTASSTARMPSRVGTWVEVQHLGSAFAGDVIKGVAVALKAGRQSQLFQIDLYAQSANIKKERHISSCQLATVQPLPRQGKAKL